MLEALDRVGAAGAVQALAARAADQVSLDDPGGVARLLEALAEAGAARAVQALAARAADQVSLDDPGASPMCWRRCT